jgi:hypothetical protein
MMGKIGNVLRIAAAMSPEDLIKTLFARAIAAEGSDFATATAELHAAHQH